MSDHHRPPEPKGGAAWPVLLSRGRVLPYGVHPNASWRITHSSRGSKYTERFPGFTKSGQEPKLSQNVVCKRGIACSFSALLAVVITSRVPSLDASPLPLRDDRRPWLFLLVSGYAGFAA